MKIILLNTFLLIALCLSGQHPAVKEIKRQEKKPVFCVGFGANLSSVNVFRNYKENPYHLGWAARATYNLKESFRLTAEYASTPKFDLDPTWLNIRSQSVSLTCNGIAYIKDQDVMIYTISGLCLQSWKGLYTGKLDFSTAKFYYKENTFIRNRNLCLDLGLGFERPFPGFNLFGDFRYRFATIDKRFGIIDAIYNLGIKFPITKNTSNKKRKSLKFWDKYHWF